MNSLLFLRGTLAVELADVGELGPLQVASSAEMGAVVAGMAENALGAAGSVLTGMASEGRSVCVMRARGTGPPVGSVGAGP